MKTLTQLIGLDNLAADYAYARSRDTGYTSAKRIADKWVHTTCGYCSVGCGIDIGVATAKPSPHAATPPTRQPRQALP